MIELDPNRSFAVQRAEHEVARQKREVIYAEQELEQKRQRLAAAQAVLDAELAKEKK